MISFVLIVCCLGSLVSSAPNVTYNIENVESYFEEFIKTYNKHYDTPHEKESRLEIFKKNLEIAIEKNKKSDQNVHGVTKFSDLTMEEFQRMYTGLKPTDASPCTPIGGWSLGSAGDASVPEAFDWRDKNVVSPVKNQGHCGSCYAFSSTGNIEAQYAKKTGQLVSLSEQQLMDCDSRAKGCGGGWMSNSFLYLQSTNGIMSEAEYPYVHQNDSCRYQPQKAQVKVSGCLNFVFSAEDELRKALVETGPLSVTVCADEFPLYTGGILRNCRPCDKYPINHGVLLVGYGNEGGTDYWTIKNSWGSNWGEQGYIRIERNVNACAMLSRGSQVVSSVLA